MAEFEDKRELSERLDLIESMIAEGRRSTARWGWTFVLWGSAYLIAIAWTQLGHVAYAWGVTMVLASVLNGVLGARQNRSDGGRQTTVGRAMMAIWTAMGVSLFIFGFGTGISRHGDLHVLFAGLETILGMAYVTSSIILRWKAQFACGVLWWATALVSFFGSGQQARIGFIVGTLVCMIAFGIYSMVRRGGCHGDVAHA